MILIRYVVLIQVIFGFLPLLSAEGSRMLEVNPKSGDGIYSLLRRYHVEHKCDIDYFYQTNKLQKDDVLKVHKKYTLPIYLFTYNDKSIRSTIGNDNWDKAKRIQEFNELLYKNKYKTADYRKDRQLWVLYSEIHCDADNPEKITKIETGGKQVKSKEEKVTSIKLVSKGGMTATKEEETTAEKKGERKKEKKETVLTDISKKTGSRKYPIFGKKHQYIPLESEQLKGTVFYVVGGHGGPDPGAIAKYGKYRLCEDEYAYDISLRLAKLLIANGALVYVITRDNDGIRSGEILPCDKDERCWGNKVMPINQKKRLTQRSSTVNKLYEYNQKWKPREQRLISIHIDSREIDERVDMFFYHYPESEAAEKIANNMRKTIKNEYKKIRPGRGYSGVVEARDLHMLRETLPNSVYVELGNILNARDRQRFLSESNRQLVAEWLFKGLVKDL